MALLRGINVGSHNRVGMAELRELVSGLGFGDVRTHMQSGNVIFTSDGALPAEAESKMQTALARLLGLEVRVIVRTRQELADVVAANPLGRVAADPSRYFVAFLSATPEPERSVGLEPASNEADQLVLSGREAYLWCPNGARETRLTNSFLEKRLGVAATSRNWNTVTRLLALAGE
ncbi:MAG: DUF1697 domain-containing protein [Acidimicrobiales bacterium]